MALEELYETLKAILPALTKSFLSKPGQNNLEKG